MTRILTIFNIDNIIDPDKIKVYNKILEGDCFSPAQFEHHLDSVCIMLVIVSVTGQYTHACVIGHAVCAHYCLAFHQVNSFF